MLFWKWLWALLWLEEAVYLHFNFPLHQSICLSNYLRKSINMLLLAIGRSLLSRNHSKFLLLIGRHTARSPTHTPIAWPPAFLLILERWAELPWAKCTQHFKKMGCRQFSLWRKSKGSVVFSLVAEWIVHWTVRGTSWTSTAVLTPHQWGADHFSPHRS